MISNVKDELDAICNKEGMRYEHSDGESIISIFAGTEKDGREYYLCDFNYYDEEYRHHAWYTNYLEK